MNIATLFAKVTEAIAAWRAGDWKTVATLALEVFQAFLGAEQPIRMQSTSEHDFSALLADAEKAQSMVRDHDDSVHASIARALFTALIAFVKEMFGF